MANIRIESAWQRMIASQTADWLLYFRKLQQDGFYNYFHSSDRIVFFFVFVPILRRELQSYSEVHNEHRIRRQSARPNHKPGVPNDLYFDSPKRWGFMPNEELLYGLEEAVKDVGKLTRINTERICE